MTDDPAASPADPSPAGPPPSLAGPALASDPEAFTVHYQLTSADIRSAGLAASRYSVSGNAVGAFALISGVLGFLVSGDVLSAVVALFGLLWLVGIIPGLLTALMAGRRPEVMQQPTDMTVGRAGIRTVTPLASGDAAWATYKRIRPAGSTLLFELGTGAVMMVPARAFPGPLLDRMLGLAEAAGVLDRSSPAAAYAKGILIGMIVSVAIPALTWLGFALGILS
jgi:hypothetical protein